MKITPVNIYKNYNYNNSAFGKAKEVNIKPSQEPEDRNYTKIPVGILKPSFGMRTKNEIEIKKQLEYLFPKSIVQDCKIDTAPIEEFSDKVMPRVTAPDGRIFVIDTEYKPNGSKLSSFVYELNGNMPVKMMCLYENDNKLSGATIYHGKNDRYRTGSDILIFMPQDEHSPTWVKNRTDCMPGYGTVEDYLFQLNNGILESH